jgi:hypothetical protein
VEESRVKPDWWTLLEDNSGGFSTLRLCLLVVVVFVMVAWAYVCWHKGELVALPDNILALVLGFAGVKAVQRIGENNPK